MVFLNLSLNMQFLHGYTQTADPIFIQLLDAIELTGSQNSVKMNFQYMILTFMRATYAEGRRPEQDSNPDFYHAGTLLDQLSYKVNWELVNCYVG